MFKFSYAIVVRKTEDEGIGTTMQVEFSQWFPAKDGTIHNGANVEGGRGGAKWVET